MYGTQAINNSYNKKILQHVFIKSLDLGKKKHVELGMWTGQQTV